MVIVIIAQTNAEVPKGPSAILERWSDHPCWHPPLCTPGCYWPLVLRDVSPTLCLVRMNK